MSDSEKTPDDSSAVEEALDKIPGLADQVGSEPQKASTDYLASEELDSDEPAQGDEPEGVAPEKREPVEDSDAVQAALNQIPGLKDQVDR